LGWLLLYLTMLYLIVTLMDWVLMVDLHTDWFFYEGPLGTPWVLGPACRVTYYTAITHVD